MQVEWSELPGKGVRLHFGRGSSAERIARAELRSAEKCVEVLEELLGRSREGEVNVYVVDATAGGVDAVGEGGVVRVVSDEPSEPLAFPIARFLLAEWFGPEAVEPIAIAGGLAGVVAARSGGGPPVSEADEWVRRRLADGRRVSILSPEDDEGPDDGLSLAPGPPPGTQPPPPEGDAGEGEGLRLAATSFVSDLIDRFGGGAVAAFFDGYDSARRDAAAVDAFQQPLGALEEAWLGRMRGGAVKGAGSFFRTLLPHFKPYWARQLEVLVYMLTGAIMAVLAMPVAVGAVVGALGGSGQGGSGGLLARLLASIERWLASGNVVAHLLTFVAVLLVLYSAESLIALRRSVVSETVAQKVLIDVQSRTFAHVLELPHSYYSSANVGDLMSRLSGDVQMISFTMSEVLNQGLYLVVSTIVAGAGVLMLDLRLGLLVLVVIPLFFATYKILGSRLARASYERSRRSGEASSLTQESLSAHGVIKAFGMEGRSLDAYRSRLSRVLASAVRMVRISSVYDAATQVAITIGQLLVLAFGGYIVIHGRLAIGVLVAFFGILPELLLPLSQFSGIGSELQSTAGSLTRVTELLEEPVTLSDAPGASPLPPLANDIRLDDVSFGYAPEHPVLHGVNISVPAGSSVAIVGPSGSGKSTIANLLMRFWDPDEGRVLFDARDVREATIASLRQQIGIVFQETFVFDTTVRENIAIGKPGATDDEIESAARVARLHEHVTSLPQGYETVLGERGVRMSGGQRQRLAIARVLLREPRVMILDEATSALDAETESGIVATLEEAARGRTTISITHRLSLAAKADRIFVLEGGRIVEEGTHRELSVAGGLYQRLFEAQTSFAAAKGSAAVDPGLLRGVPLFVSLDATALEAVAAQLRPERYGPGQEIVRRGDVGDRLFLVQSGRLDVIAGGDGGVKVATLSGGDYFGEIALVSGHPRNATVRSATPVALYSLVAEDFGRLLEHNPGIRSAVEEEIEKREAALGSALEAVGARPA